MRFRAGQFNNFNAIQADLAESWESTKDAMTWTFHLRRGVQFHRGFGELRADDVVYHYQRIMDVATASPYREDYANVAAVKALDPYTVRFQLGHADPFFLLLVVGSRAGNIVSGRAIETEGKSANTRPVGTGPFVVDEYVPRKGVFLSANPSYFGGRPTLEHIEFHFVPDMNSLTLGMKGHELESAEGIADKRWVGDMQAAGAHFGQRERSFRSIVNAGIGDRERSGSDARSNATLGPDERTCLLSGVEMTCFVSSMGPKLLGGGRPLE